MPSIYEVFYKDKNYINICKKINYQLYNDLFQDTIELIIKKKWDIESINNKGELRFFFYRVCYYTSKSDSFKNRYGLINRSYYIDKSDETIDKTIIDAEEYIVNEIYSEDYSDEEDYYRKNLIRLYIKHGSMRKLNKATGIPMMTICYDIQKYKKELKKKYDKIIDSK